MSGIGDDQPMRRPRDRGSRRGGVPTPPRGTATGSRRGSRRSGVRVALWIAAGVLAVLVACVVWVGVRGFLAVEELQAARASISEVQQDVTDGDLESVESRTARLTERLSTARSLTTDPVWRAAEIVPGAGPNLSALRETTEVLDRLGGDVITPLVSTAVEVKGAADAAEDGVIPLQPLVDAAPALQSARQAADDASRRIEALDTSQVLPQLRDAVEELRPILATTADALAPASALAQVVPDMLGADGPRTLLALFLNNAELRSSGGIVGALAEISADQGRIALGRQSSASAMTSYPESAIPLENATRGIFGDPVGRYMQNASGPPQFPLTGQLAQEMWARDFGTRVDGVLSMDPIALSYLLEATGPVTLPTGDELRSDNVVQLLLQEVYARYQPQEQDVFFAAAAAEVFGKVASGDADPIALLRALAKAEGEGRLNLWSADPDEQALLEQTTLAGTLPRSTEDTAVFGVYLNDRTVAKMDYYLDASVRLSIPECSADGVPLYEVAVTLTNTAPADAGQVLTDYVTGGGLVVEPGRIRTDVAVYGPPGTVFRGAQRDGQELPVQPAADGEYPLAQFRTEPGPGESVTTVLQFAGTVPSMTDLGVQITPLIREVPVETLTRACSARIH